MENRRGDYSRSRYTHRPSSQEEAEKARRREAARKRAAARDSYASRQNATSARQGVNPAYTSAYINGHGNVVSARQHKRRNVLLVAIIALLCICAIVVFVFFPPFYNVTVNGTTQTVNAGATLQSLVDNGFASPKAGNLVAVDGKLLKEGAGKPFSATVDGAPIDDTQHEVGKDAIVEISDGADAVEEYTESTETLKHATSEQTATANSYYIGSIHLYSDGEDGTKVTRTGKVSGKTVSEVTKQPIDSGFNAYTADVGNDKVVAITFDDGPWPETSEEILSILNENGARATFFEIGNQVEEYPEITQKLAAAGNQIATHSYDHASGSGQGVNLTYMSHEEQINEVTKGISAIEKALGHEVSHVLRAPGGNYYGEMVETLHPYVEAEVGWDVDTQDWSRPGTDVIASRIESAKPGQVILCHDGGGNRSQTVEALKTALPYLKSQGYSFITVDELLAYGPPSS